MTKSAYNSSVADGDTMDQCLPFDDLPGRAPGDSVPEDPRPVSGRREKRNIQDFLPVEAILAVKLSAGVATLEELQRDLVQRLGQNSIETRIRYAQLLQKWFFSDGLDGLARKAWVAYADESLIRELLRYQYLRNEPIVGRCVSEALFPLDNGILIPADYFDGYLRAALNGVPPAKTSKRLKTNLMKLGFLERGRGRPDRLKPINPSKTTLLILLHNLFAPKEPRTVELKRLFADPFWRYLGYKSETAVRSVLRDAAAAGLLGKYVVADQIEQITTNWSFPEFVAQKARL